jgi:Uma2 family endonuclease
MATVPLVGEERFVLDDVSWEAYEALLRSWASRSKHTTYDRGKLEIMSPLLAHAQFARLLGQMVEAFTLERRIPRHSGRCTTFRKEAEQRGLEPDECYWIQNEERMRSRKEFDPESDPPPDLAIEVDITSSSLPRMSIYADLGVPEVWRFDGTTFTINLLRLGNYEQAERGLALPALTAAVVARFLARSDEVGEMAMMFEFLDWVRAEAATARAPRPRRPRRK